MNRTPNIAVVKIGFNSFAFEDPEFALQLMALMSKAVIVEEETWGLRDDTPCTHFLAEDSSSLPELKFISIQKFNPNETKKEAKDRFAREKKDREDMEQNMKVVPGLVELPHYNVNDEGPF